MGQKKKCHDVLINLKLKNFNIYLIQATHLTTGEENYIETIWYYNVFFN